MNTKTTAVIAILLGLTLRTQGAENSTGLYFIGDVGLNLVHDLKFERLLGVNATGLSAVSVDPGVRATVGVGYDFIPTVGAELEAGFVYNETKTYNSVIGGVPLNGSIRLWQVPVTVGVTWRPVFAPAPKSDVEINYGQAFLQNLRPFVGAGIGAAGIFAEVDNSAATTNPVDADGHDTVLTYYLKAGLMYPLSDRTEIGFQYRFYGSPGFTIKETKSEEIYSHAMSVALRLRF
jgi:opacity protein-like surface antigen